MWLVALTVLVVVVAVSLKVANEKTIVPEPPTPAEDEGAFILEIL
jgi:hypothetical protein